MPDIARDLSLWIVIFVGSGVLVYIALMIWWKVLDELLKLFNFKKKIVEYVLSQSKRKARE